MTSGQSKDNKEFGDYDDDPDERGEAYPQDGQNEGGTSERTEMLARHKKPMIGSNTSLWPPVMWGTQDMLAPVSPRAMAGSATPRVQTLATPKKDFQEGTVHEGRPLYYYSSGRPSMIWSVSEGAKNGSSTERVQFLAQHKQYHPDWAEHKEQFYFSCGRDSPIANVKPGAMQCKERPRTTVLAVHKDFHPDFQDERAIQSKVTLGARKATASDRVASLAVPKQRSEGSFRNPQWPVSNHAKSSVASTRCTELAKSKPLAEGFQHARNVEWPVSQAAMHAQASGRVEELSRPITRDTMDHVQFNPNAFIVKESALKGVIPQRIQDLAQPANR